MINFNKTINFKSHYWLFSALVSCVLMFGSCQEQIEPDLDENESQEFPKGWFNKADYELKDRLASKLASNLASKMKYPEVRSFIKNEIAGKDDGMNSFIFQFVDEKTINYQNSNNQRVTTTFGRLLASDDNSTANLRNANSFLDSLREHYPTLHIAIPDINDNLGQEWDGETELDVVYSPDKFAYEVEEVQVFKGNGEEYAISPYAEPDNNLVVVGINHKVVAVPNDEVQNRNLNSGSSVLRCPTLEPMYIDDQYTYYDAQAYYDCYDEPIPPGTGGGGSNDDNNDPSDCVPTATRSNNSGKEHMTKFKYRDIDAFRHYHGTWRSIPRHVLYVIYYDKTEDKAKPRMKSFLPSRSDLRDYHLFSPTVTKWYATNEEIQTWIYKEHGNMYEYFWILKGSGNTTTTTLDSDIGDVSVSSHDGDRIVGDAAVEYCDESINGYIYSTGSGGIDFEVKQMN